MKSKKKSGKSTSKASPAWVKRDPNTGRFIEAALKNTRYKARTIEGIAKEAKVSRSEVVYAIKHDARLREKVNVFPRRSKDGRVLITTKDRFSKEASVKDKFIYVFSTKLPKINDE